MKNVHEMTKDFVAKEMELMDACISMVGASSLLNMSGKELELMGKTIGLMNAANDLMVEQARLLVEMNEKLDKLMEANKK